MDRGNDWHVDNGVLFVGKGFKPGKGFLPWFENRDHITGLILEEGYAVIMSHPEIFVKSDGLIRLLI